MKPLAKRSTPASLAAKIAAVALMVVVPRVALADDTIKHPGDHPRYSVEAEPHVLLGWDNIYASGGYGVGGRFSIPVVQNGFVESINNSVAVSFGMDVLHYEGCAGFRGIGCSASYLFFPVAMQWNFFVGQRWSVFGEPGLFIFHGFVDECAPNTDCNRPNVNGIRPAMWIGGRYHLSETVSLTLRIGWPAFTFGVSFFP